MDLKNISSLHQSLLEQLETITTIPALEAFRLSHLSRQGTIAEAMTQLKSCSVEEKRELGPALQEFKRAVTESFEAKSVQLHQAALQAEQNKQKHFDITAQKRTLTGSLHPYTTLIQEIEDIFISMGFAIADGPELETPFHNFEALNVPEHHPAREESDTFWINPERLLRTQTSTVQIRTMLEQEPPIAVIAPGRVFRNESTDASHDFMFMQVEGLYVAKNVSIAQLLGTLNTFLTTLFKKEMKIRVRPGYFPFVEPGLEIDASCPFCTTGCSTCKKTTWIELLGAGLIHPNVLRACNIDPEIYSGYAFGFGLTRLAMLRHHINDLRLLHGGNITFLKQF
jgi:phenylalanyl-tRNA synthetase alpha chain